MITLNEVHICHRLWGPSEFSKSSTWRELAAIDCSRSFAPVLEDSLIKWFTDSQSAAKVVEVGSMKLDLHRLAVKIFQFCAKHTIRFEVQWIPRTENEKADYISRLIDFDDWQITPECFLRLEESWGPHIVDCFANFLQRNYQDLFPLLESGDIRGDFFVQNLESENCLVVPPVSLFAQTLHYLILQKSRSNIVMPVWPSSSFWPLLTSKISSS